MLRLKLQIQFSIMIRIKEIVEKIKYSYPKIRVEEKVKISKQFIADYVKISTENIYLDIKINPIYTKVH